MPSAQMMGQTRLEAARTMRVYVHLGEVAVGLDVALDGAERGVRVRDAVQRFLSAAGGRLARVADPARLLVKDGAGQPVQMHRRLRLVVSEDDPDLFLEERPAGADDDGGSGERAAEPLGPATAQDPAATPGDGGERTRDERSASLASLTSAAGAPRSRATSGTSRSARSGSMSSSSSNSNASSTSTRTSGGAEPAATDSDGSEAPHSEKDVPELLKLAQEDYAARRVRSARLRCEEVLAIDADATEARVLLSRIHLDCGRFQRGLQVLEELPPGKLQGAEIAELRGDLAAALHEHGKATVCFEIALKELVGKDETNTVRRGAATIPRRCIIQVKKARTLLARGHKKEAYALIEQVVHADPHGPANADGLLFYGECFQESNQFEEGVRAQLRGLTAAQEHVPVRNKISDLFRTRPESTLKLVHEVFAAIKGDAAKASAMSFLAEVARMNSGIRASLELYEQACSLAPAEASYALNYVHVLEIDLKYVQAMRALHQFFSALPSSQQGQEMDERILAACADACAVAEAAIKVLQGDVQAAAPFAFMLSKEDSSWPSWDRSKDCEISVEPIGPEEVTAALPLRRGPKKAAKRASFAKAELETIACFFLMVKLLYQAHPSLMRLVPPIISHLDPIRKDRDLHFTLARNEQAYYTTVAELLLGHEDKLRFEDPYEPFAPKDKLYLFGDSHSLSLAWHEITFRGRPHEVVPKLATGVKAWHLRDSSNFFPKFQFQRVAGTIPEGSFVVALFCEIDCREGLVAATAKDRYDSVEEAIDCAIKIYLDRLAATARQRKWAKTFVHPVPSVLTSTRPVVFRFNIALEQAVLAHPDLVWLDFFLDLLDRSDPNNFCVKDEFKLDGTHMSAAYLPILEKSLNRCDERTNRSAGKA